MTLRLRQVFISIGILSALTGLSACSTVVGKMVEVQLDHQSAPPAVAPIRNRAAGNEEMMFWADALESSLQDFESMKGDPVSSEDREFLVARSKAAADAMRKNKQLREAGVGAVSTQKTYQAITKSFENTEYFESTVSLSQADRNYIFSTPPTYLGLRTKNKTVGFNAVIPVDTVEESIEVANHYAGMFRHMVEGQDGWKVFDSATQSAEAAETLQSIQEYEHLTTGAEAKEMEEKTKATLRKRANMENHSSQSFTYQWTDENSPMMVSNTVDIKLPTQIIFAVENLMIADTDPARQDNVTYPEVAISVYKVTPVKADAAQ